MHPINGPSMHADWCQPSSTLLALLPPPAAACLSQLRVDDSPEGSSSILTHLSSSPSGLLKPGGMILAAVSLKWGEWEFTAQQEPIRNFITKSSLPFDSFLYPWRSGPRISRLVCLDFLINIYTKSVTLGGSGEEQTE